MGEALIEGDAVLSSCRTFRYRLTRAWGSGPGAVFIMLNPSTADELYDDPTIRRCIRFARREGCGSLTVVNLFAYRTKRPVMLKTAPDPVGPSNDHHIREVLTEATGPVIAAWGAHGVFKGRGDAVRRMTDVPLWCFGKTANGAPRHPLYVKGDTPLVLF